MNLAYFIYMLFSTALFLFFAPVYIISSALGGRFGKRARQRLGFYPKSIIAGINGSPRIWLHAVSVGEVGAAVEIVKALRVEMPDCAIVLSTATGAGQRVAREKLSETATCIYAPLDFIPSVRIALTSIRPDVLVLLETEIWPNWLVQSCRRGIRTALVNGRISVRSIGRYLKIRPLMRAALAHIEVFSMISPADAQRIKSIGAAQDKVFIAGNAKYDPLLERMDTDQKIKTAARYNLTGSEPVLVAGSTRGNEAHIILNVYEQIYRTHPETLLIIAPRHIERSREIEMMVRQRGLSCQLRTDLYLKDALRTAPVVILDTIGELQTTYSIASIVFCGGSLVPLGGQNILEAAVWGKPVLYGPSMEDFQDAKELLDRTGSGIQVADESDFLEKVRHLIENPREAAAIGSRAREAVMTHKGAARKHADAIRNLLAQD